VREYDETGGKELQYVITGPEMEKAVCAWI